MPWWARRERRRLQLLRDARDRYITDDELPRDAVVIMNRLHRPMMTIPASAVYAHGLIDPHGVKIARAQEWQIAKALRDGSPHPTRAVINQWAAALEEYVARVEHADECLRALQEFRTFTSGDEVLAYLAAPAANNAPVGEAAAAAALTAALEAANNAAPDEPPIHTI
ncbi:hypothetical protein ACIBW9_41855 [Streptomyces sp. NPDC049541]|uniref:hypothetical protein n=1 Tax=Streptomyces sp. NPDC049541 TaxID=3365594 RepID=UPI0037908098